MIKLLNYYSLFFCRLRCKQWQPPLCKSIAQHRNITHYSPAFAIRYVHSPKSFFACIAFFISSVSFAQSNLTIRFIHTANEKILVQGDSIYHNVFGEPYRISKLKYYVSNISLGKKKENVFLVNAFENDSLCLHIIPGTYTKLSFLLGVDSLHNCLGAQDGALDPLNDMFWTWNSGYVMFKLEGSSDSSMADLHRIEHHIGGYKGAYKTMRDVVLDMKKPLVIKNKGKYTIVIQMNMDKYWQSMNDIKICALPVIVTGGAAAAASADNFARLFTIKSAD